MKKVIIVLILLFSFIGADSKLQNTLASKQKFEKRVNEMVPFMENFKQLELKQKESAELFQKYLNSHLEFIACCKNLEDDFKLDVKKGISNYQKRLYRKEIYNCKESLKSSTHLYEIIERIFNEGLETLNRLKSKNTIVKKRYKRLKQSLAELDALIDYLRTLEK